MSAPYGFDSAQKHYNFTFSNNVSFPFLGRNHKLIAKTKKKKTSSKIVPAVHFFERAIPQTKSKEK